MVVKKEPDEAPLKKEPEEPSSSKELEQDADMEGSGDRGADADDEKDKTPANGTSTTAGGRAAPMQIDTDMSPS